MTLDYNLLSLCSPFTSGRDWSRKSNEMFSNFLMLFNIHSHTCQCCLQTCGHLFLTIAFLIRPVGEQQGFHCPLNLAAQQITLAWLRWLKSPQPIFLFCTEVWIKQFVILRYWTCSTSSPACLVGEGVEFLKRGTITLWSLVCYHSNT